MVQVARSLGAAFREAVRSWICGPEQLTVTEGWEQYAQQFATTGDRNLGDEWNEPERIGFEGSEAQVVSGLDQRVFAPFLGNPDVILEIGSGGGRFTEVLLPKCSRLIASDTSPSMLKLVRKRFGEDPRVETLLLDGLGLSAVPNESIDAAFSYGVFVHLQHWDIYNYIRELHRVLKPGGKAIIHHANTFSELGWNVFQEQVRPSLNRHKLPWTFVMMTPEIMREFVERAGLIVEACNTEVVQRDCITLVRKQQKLER